MSIYGPLVTPDQTVDLLVAVASDATARQEHLAELERQKGLTPRSVPDFRTIGHLVQEDDLQPQDDFPALLIGDVGTTDPPEEDKDRCLYFRWMIAAEISYLGVSRADAARGVRWYAMAVTQLLLQRTPRNTDVLQRLVFRDMEPLDPGPTLRVGRARLLFEATTGPSLAVNGALPLALPDIPSPVPFPPDPPDDPYDPPADWPPVETVIADVDRVPLDADLEGS